MRKPTAPIADPAPIVYVVDDDPSVRAALEDLLASMGLQVRAFASTQAFLEHDLEDAPACLVLDVRMPGQSGLEFHRTMGSHGLQLPVVFITGHGDVPWEDAFRALGHIGYEGPISIEWEDAGMDRLHGAAEAVGTIRSLLWKRPEASFDAAFSNQ